MTTTIKNKNKTTGGKGAFPPTDRELALRGEIKTGWSTVALHQNLKNLGLDNVEMTKLEKVLKRAEAVERINQLRIGVEMMKHQQNKDNHLGDGQRTCLICGIDFSNHQYRRKPVSVHFCDRCSSAICSSCMLADKKLSGDAVTLCPLCYEEKEIWKKSGAWFINALPVIDISQTELEEFEEKQKQLSLSRTFTLGKQTSIREFVNPYQLEAESSDSDEDELHSFNLGKSSPEPPAAAAASSSFPPPISFVDTPHLQEDLQRPSAHKPSSSSTFPRRSASPSELMSDIRNRSGTYGSETSEPIGRRLPPLGADEVGGEKQRIIRRGAMSTVDKTRLDTSRKRALGTLNDGSGSQESGSQHRTQRESSLTSSTSSESAAAEFAKMSPKREVGQDGEQRHRQLPNPPRRPPPQLLTLEEGEPLDQSAVEVFIDPPTPKPRKPAAGVRRRREAEEMVRPLEDEFKKVAVAPPTKKPPVLTSGTDEFRKVGMVAMATSSSSASKPPPPNKPAPIAEFDEFKKVTPKSKPPPRVADDDESKKIDTVPESPTRKPMVPPRDEFRKVSPPKQIDKKKPSPPPPRPESDNFRKVSPVKPDLTKKKPSPPPPRTELDEFRKVGIAALATSSSTSKHPPLPSKSPVSSFDEKRASSRDITPPHRSSMSPSGSPLRRSVGEVPPPLPPKPREEESPKCTLGELSKIQSDDDSKSIVSTTSSLASQTSSINSPAVVSPRDQSPTSSAGVDETDYGSVKSKTSPVHRQGEIDEDHSFRFRTRSGAVRSGSRGRSSSPGVAQVIGEKKPETKKDDTTLFDEFDEFQPRARARSGVVVPRTTPRSVSHEDKPQPSVRTMRTSHSVTTQLPDVDGSQGDDVKTTPSPPPSRGDVSQPRMRTRSRAFHGGRPRQQATTGGGSNTTKEDSPTGDDAVQPRMRTRSRAFHGDSQRPRKIDRTPSPSSAPAAKYNTIDVHSSLDIPRASSSTRPRSSSIGQGLQRTSDSRRSVTKPDGAFGSVELQLEYVEGENLLNVKVAKCKGLRAMDGNGYSDPYVKLFLLPGNRIHRFQTKTVHKNLDPVYEETFQFYSVSMEAMKSKQLCIIVMDYDEFSTDDFIGSTRVKLYEVLYSQSHKINIRRLLDDNIVDKSALEDKTRGRVRLTFSYSSEKETFNVFVHKAEHLVPDSTKGICDPYVKCYFESAGSNCCIKKKTSVSKKTLSPVFDQVLEFPEKLVRLGLACLRVSVWDRSKLPSMEIGAVEFKDAVFWKEFVEQPNLTITDWYVLYAPDHITNAITPKHHRISFSRKYV